MVFTILVYIRMFALVFNKFIFCIQVRATDDREREDRKETIQVLKILILYRPFERRLITSRVINLILDLLL